MSYLDNGWGRYEWEIRDANSSGKLLTILKQHHANLEEFEWLKVIQSQYFTNDIFKLYENDIPWAHILVFRKVPIEYLEKYFDELNIYECSAFQPLTAAFIKRHKDTLSLDVIVRRDDLEKDAMEMAQKLYKQNDDPLHHRRWDQNLLDSSFCPKNFTGHYKDYQTSEELATVENKDRTKSEAKPKEKAKKPVKKDAKSTIKAKKSKQQKIILDYSTMKKAELKEILAKRNVRVFYHDTLEILIEKCKESEVA